MNEIRRYVWTLCPDGYGGTQWGVSGRLPSLKETYPLVMVMAKDYDEVERENRRLKRELEQMRESLADGFSMPTA